MSRSFWSYAAAVVYAVAGYITTNPQFYAMAAASLAGGAQAERQRRARNQARDAYNASLQDRMVMLDLQPDAPRTLALGRVRVVEGVRRRWTSGENSTQLTMIVSFAGHEIDGFETFWANDIALTLDEDGWAQTAPYLKGTVRTEAMEATLDSEGEASVTLTSTPIAGTVTAVWVVGSGQAESQGTCTVDGSGTAITITGGVAGATARINWQSTLGQSVLRIRPYLGTDAQNIGADLADEYPGKITATDRFAGMAAAVIDVLYDPDVFPQGVPNFTATLRGAKCLDPRTGLTVWTRNPMLHAYLYARLGNGWAVPADEIAEADVEAEADFCDLSTEFVLGEDDVTLPRYQCDLVLSSDADPRQNMAAIMETMAGRWGWAGGVLRFRCGRMAPAVFTIDESWLAQRMGSDGRPEREPVARLVNGVQADERVNRVSGKCVDPDQRYQFMPFPTVKDDVLIDAQGEHAQDVDMPGVAHIAHAQHLASILIRRGQAPLSMELRCNLHAYRCELFDVGEANLPRYVTVGKPFEVIGWRWHPTEGVRLTCAEVSEEMFEPVDSLQGRDPAPNGDIPSPWSVPQLTGLEVTSGTVTLTDASVITRTQATWDAATVQAVLIGGKVEVQYIEAAVALPAGDWPSWEESGDSTQATIPGLRTGRYYLFRARFRNAMQVRGPWSEQVLHGVALPPAVEADQLYIEYSVDGATDWHGTFTSGDLYTRWRLGTTGDWEGPWRIVGEDGSAGEYFDFRFRRSATQPATPTGDTPASWFDAPPAPDGTPLWTTIGRKTAAGSLIGTWSTPRQIEGAAGDRTAVVYIYRRAATSPPLPSNTTTYTFATGLPTGMNNSWSATVPSGTDPLWVSAATATGVAAAATDTIASGEWATPSILAQDGLKSATVFIYRRTGSASAPALPSATATYTFDPPGITGLNNSWVSAVPDPAGGAYLWVSTATALGTGSTDNIASGEWATARLLAQDGGTGQTGQSNHRVYRAVTIGSPPSTPSNTTSGATPSGWSATPLTLSAGQEQYQSDGTTPAGSTTTTWSTPYPSYLKVGSLSAITANLGTVTAGDITGTATIAITGSAVFDGVASSITVQTAESTTSKTMAVRANYAAGSAAIAYYGRSTASGGYGMYAEATGANGVGIFGYGSTGVLGKAASGGVGVAGYATGSASAGIYGRTNGNSNDGGLFETGGVGGGASNTALRARANNSAHTALAVEGGSTFSARITSTLAGTNVPLVLPVVSSKPTAVAGGVCLHNTLGLIVSDGTNWYGPSGGLVTV